MPDIGTVKTAVGHHASIRERAEGVQEHWPGGVSLGVSGGIIPDPNWAKQTRVIPGDGEAGVQQLGSRGVRCFFGAVITAAIAAGICWAYINSAIT